VNFEVGKEEQQLKAMVKEVGESIKPIGGNMKQVRTMKWQNK
jgi:hypothetical protein